MEAPFRLPEFRGVARPLPLDRNNTCRGQHSARQSQAKTYTGYYSLQTQLARVPYEHKFCQSKAIPIQQPTTPYQHWFRKSKAIPIEQPNMPFQRMPGDHCHNSSSTTMMMTICNAHIYIYINNAITAFPLHFCLLCSQTCSLQRQLHLCSCKSER